MKTLMLKKTIAVAVLLATAQATLFAATVSNKVTLDGTRAGIAESNLGNFVADAARSSSNADAAIIPASELRRVTIPAGPVDSEKIVAALRASSDDTDTVVVLKLSGAQLRKAFERSLGRSPSPYEGFLQVSGICVTYDPTKPRLARVIDITISGRSVLPAQTYNIATTRLLSDGALGYFEVWTKSDVVSSGSSPLSRIVNDFAVSRQPLNYSAEGRILAK